jgi:hypothetical protein
MGSHQQLTHPTKKPPQSQQQPTTAAAALLLAGSAPAPALAAGRGLKQQQQQQPIAAEGLGDLLSSLGLGGGGGGPNADGSANLASVIDRAIAQIPAQQRIGGEDGLLEEQQQQQQQLQQSITMRDGGSRATATASGDATSIGASADDGLPETEPEREVVVGRGEDDGIAGDGDAAARGAPFGGSLAEEQGEEEQGPLPATSASSSRAVSTTPGRPAVASASATTSSTGPSYDEFGQEREADYPQQEDVDGADDTRLGDGDRRYPPLDRKDAAAVREDVDQGLQRVAAGVNGTYGALAGILSNLTGGAFALPPLASQVSRGPSSAAAALEDAAGVARATPTQELVSTSGACSASAASTLVAAAAGGAALLAMVAF